MKISVSLLNAKERKKAVEILNETEIDYFHIDIMDGKFIPHKEYSINEINEISSISRKKLDIHLMVKKPEKYIKKLVSLPNINNITFHLEINRNINKIINHIKKYNIKCGLSIKPDTDINELKPYINKIDLILIMTVNPGEGGQELIPATIGKLHDIKKMIENYPIVLEVDGGINNNTIKEVKDASIAVVGSYITKSNSMIERINNLKE